jgi:mRNA interferase RelE/StbE
MTWRVELDAGARKDLRAIRDARLRGRILRALQKLEAEPRPADAKRLAGHARLWRLRVGDWRIAYAIRDEMVLVLVVAVGTRGEIYEMVRRRER